LWLLRPGQADPQVHEEGTGRAALQEAHQDHSTASTRSSRSGLATCLSTVRRARCRAARRSG
jgi:hypothetical protein